jgi:hypothetical protein
MLYLFGIFTLIYFMLRVFVTDTFPKRKDVNIMKWVMMAIYIFMVISMQVANTSNTMNKMCNNSDIGPAIIYTLIPNVLVFGTLVAILIAMPGWKAPFSNTIGFMAAKGMGINSYFQTLINSKIDNDLLEKITQDNSLIINEITPGNFDLFIAQMGTNGLLQVDYEDLSNLEKGEEVKNTNKYTTKDPMTGKIIDGQMFLQDSLDALAGLYRAVVFKDLVAESLWYFLTGLLVITMIQSSIAEIECEKNPREAERDFKRGATISAMEAIQK